MAAIAQGDARISAGVKSAIAWVVVSIVAVAASTLSALNGRQPEVFLPVGLAGLVYAAAGALVYNRRPDNLIGPMLLAVAGLSCGLVAVRYLFPITVPFNEAFGNAVNLVPLAFVVLSFPSGQLAPGSIERRVMSLVLVLAVFSGLAEVLTFEPALHMEPGRCAPCTLNPLRLFDAGLYQGVTDVTSAVGVAAIVLVSGVAVRRWARARGMTRSALTPVMVGGLILGTAASVFITLDALGSAVPFAPQILLLLRVLVPVGLAVVFLRLFSARSGVARAILELGRGTSVPRLEVALRRALGDPDVAVARWSPTADAYLDTEGRRVEVEWARNAGGLLEIQRDGVPLAAVMHDPALAADPKLKQAVGDAARFALDVAELRDELSARGGDVDRLPRGDVAFLFGDVEGSTELLARLGDDYGPALTQLRDIVRRAAERHFGQVVDVRADECFLAFGDSPSALEAAVDIQRRMADLDWPQGDTMRLRIGLHQGRPGMSQDGYVGLDVHRAARVMSAAHGGQIVVSEAVVRSLAGKLPANVGLASLGRFQLKGLPDADILYQVVAPGLVQDFPPPRGVMN